MKSRDEILNILKKFKDENAELGIKLIGLFGSCAREEQNDTSDIDICVKLEKADFLSFYKIKTNLSELFENKVDLISLHKYLDPAFVYSINKDIIYV